MLNDMNKIVDTSSSSNQSTSQGSNEGVGSNTENENIITDYANTVGLTYQQKEANIAEEIAETVKWYDIYKVNPLSSLSSVRNKPIIDNSIQTTNETSILTNVESSTPHTVVNID